MKNLKSEIIHGSKKYFCLVRKSFIPATPEEEVRQNFLRFLIEDKSFPISRIKVEESLAHYGKGKRRVDILVLDESNTPLIIYECKKPNEALTDEVMNQLQDYYEKLNTVQYLGLVIGDTYRFIGKDKKENIIYFNDHPDYFTLINGGQFSKYEPQFEAYQRYDWRIPIKPNIINNLIEYGVIGEGTDQKFHSFIINLDGWLLDWNDKVFINDDIEDIGIKYTKFGSAGGGFFPNYYRSFLLPKREEKPIICIAICGIRSSNKVPFGTCIYVGIETTNYKNASLILRINKTVDIKNEKVLITHNGTITVGKLGAANSKDLLSFVQNRNPNLIKNGRIFLGEFHEKEEINSSNVGNLIKNIIEYALLRNEFREIRKQNIKNN